MNSQQRHQIKQAVLSAIQPIYGYMILPVPLKHLIRQYKNIVLISYSKFMRTHDFSYRQMLDYAGTKDAFTDYDAATDRFIICYNDLDHLIMSSNRYRWNIAHELGHIFLHHHKKHSESRLFRNSLSEESYKNLEDEADQFAAYILVPHSVLLFLRIQTKQDIASFCKISGNAASYRIQEYNIWSYRKHSVNYDFDILNAYAYYIDESVRLLTITDPQCIDWIENHNTCPVCNIFWGSFTPKYCPICGHRNILPHWGVKEDSMTYQGIELNEKGQAQECPICHNIQHLETAEYCMICGNIVTNHCTAAISNDYEAQHCYHTEPLPGNARYCPYCGQKTTFFEHGLLKSWDNALLELSNSFKSSNVVNSIFLPESDDVDDSDVPF